MCLGILLCRPSRDLWWQVYTGLNNRPPCFLEPLHVNIAYFRSQKFSLLHVNYGHWSKLHVKKSKPLADWSLEQLAPNRPQLQKSLKKKYKKSQGRVTLLVLMSSEVVNCQL